LEIGELTRVSVTEELAVWATRPGSRTVRVFSKDVSFTSWRWTSIDSLLYVDILATWTIMFGETKGLAFFDRGRGSAWVAFEAVAVPSLSLRFFSVGKVVAGMATILRSWHDEGCLWPWRVECLVETVVTLLVARGGWGVSFTSEEAWRLLLLLILLS
jgi:hypothetical protein